MRIPQWRLRIGTEGRRMSKLDDTIADVAYILDTLMAYRNIVQTGNCNSCRMARTGLCPYLPKVGQLVRYNCPLYKGLGQEDEE